MTRRVWLTDGALGTEYQRRGLAPGMPADFWVLDAPEQVLYVTQDYARAGSDVVLTTTFRANPLSLAEYGRAEDTRRINLLGAKLAREAAPGKLVFGDAGPTGKARVDAAAVERAFAVQCEGLAEGGVDAVVFETFTDLEEARLALRAAEHAGLRAVVSFSFHTGMDAFTPEDAARQMTEAGAWGVGSNCGNGLDGFARICRRMRSVTSLPLWMKPNAGLPDGKLRYAVTPVQFAASARTLVDAGADYVGGCCGTTPEFIRTAATNLRLTPS